MSFSMIEKQITGKTKLATAVGVVLLAGTLSMDAGAEVVLDKVIVSATKKATAEDVQDVPSAITAFGDAQLEERFTRDLKSLSYAMPNVSLEDIGTTKGVANFSVRGLGINSSIPSTDPTVGVFVDGVYIGLNVGVVLDVFDLAGIEVLRGPQGTLFGRNVTGGAILIKTRKPTDTFSANAKLSYATGSDKIVAGSISGPIAQGVLDGRMTVFYENDGGWFTNLADGKSYGGSDTLLVRPSLTWTVGDDFDTTLRYEHGRVNGDDGSASQNHALFSRNSFDFTVNRVGFSKNDWDQAILESNLHVGFGNGVITNIFGWRDFENFGRSDIDGTINLIFHSTFKTLQHQYSDELRYAGRFADRVDLTVGLYWFAQNMNYFENRLLGGGAVDSTMGGMQYQSTYAAFAQSDIDVGANVTLNLGVRYTSEHKHVKIATFVNSTAGSRCDINTLTCDYNFYDDHDWSDVSPKVGAQWKPTDNAQLYGFWAKGFRSGGYNVRNTDPTVPPGPYDSESQNSVEVGAKVDWLDDTLRTNLAVFYNTIDGMQRDVNTPGAVGVVQVTANTADATVKGVELEVEAVLPAGFTLTGSVGYLDGTYDRILDDPRVGLPYDLNGDGVRDNRDRQLEIPRLAPLTYSAGVSHEAALGAVTLASRINFSHRDKNYYTDNNRGYFDPANILDASVAVKLLDEKLSISVYGNNLTDEVTIGGDTQLPPTFGGVGASYSPLNKGRVYGLELNWKL